MTQSGLICTRMKIVLILFLLGIIYVIFVLYRVQIERHEELLKKARDKYTTQKVLTGTRGEIFDYEGKLLVGNIPTMDVIADPSLVGDEPECRRIAYFFSQHLRIPFRQTFGRLMRKEIEYEDPVTHEKKTKPRRYVVIERNVDYEQAQALIELEKKENFKGLSFCDSFKRNYPKNSLASNIVGITTSDCDRIKALNGIEKQYDKDMQSQKTVSVYERSRDGVPISYGFNEMAEYKNGRDIFLTIREPIQAIMEEELDKLMAESKAKAVYAIMADPYTGNIMAVAQRPTFNPNDREEITPDAYRIRFAEDTMEPGSIMKPFTVAGALDLGVVRPETQFSINGGLWYYAGKPLRDSHPNSILSVTEIIKESSNIGTAKIALEMGNQQLDTTLRSFGFGQKTGLFRTETRGIYHPLKRWNKLTPTRICMGQGVSVTPLQLVRAYCMLANGGHPVTLRLVDRFEGDGEVKKLPVQRAPSIFHRPQTHREIVSMMKLVTEPGGTAIQAAVPGFSVAGKTGTAQKVIGGQYSNSKYIASFVGFIPADKPRFVLLVSVDEPSGGKYYGGSVSGPYFRAIAERTLKYQYVAPDIPLEQWEAKRKEQMQRHNERKRMIALAEQRRRAERTSAMNR